MPRTKKKSKIAWLNLIIGLFLLIAGTASVTVSLFDSRFANRVYPNVFIDGISFGGKTQSQVAQYWNARNKPFPTAQFELKFGSTIATISGSDIDLGYDANLSADQAYLIGRSNNWLTNIRLKFFEKKIDLAPYFRWKQQIVNDTISSLSDSIDIPQQNALFQFKNGRVSAFKPSKDGQKLNQMQTQQRLTDAFRTVAKTGQQFIVILLPVEPVRPTVATDATNTFGIKTLIGEGYSEFEGSIPGRIHNVALAADRLNGILIKPGDVFSFDQAVGDISAATGYESAYIIKDGHTVLGDGGGVCQVSTTLFRAALNAGLPITERHAHDYRVHYYEEGGYKPGLDATVYSPSVDLKFKNDTPGYILIQTKIDLDNLTLTFDLYGTSDDRTAQVSNFKLWDVTPPPPDLYQDDPTLPKGTIKQVDFTAWGAKASFDYLVTRGGQTIENTTFYSNFQPWQAVYLRGTM